MKSHGHIVYYSLSNFLFSCIKHSPSLAMWGKLHMAHHGCRPRIAILNRSQINLCFLEKYLTTHFFQVNTSLSLSSVICKLGVLILILGNCSES